MLDFEAQYEAFRRRDPAWDGVIFVGVRSTGVYCRPICRARTPLARNVRFFLSAAAAENAGFRPCLRCRPESVPFCPAWKGTRTTVDRALTLIEDGALERAPLGELAERLGVGSRHLTRLFTTHLGVPPMQVARTVRIHRALKLLGSNDLSIDAIARHAGFASAHRMRAAFVRLYGRPPSTFRARSSVLAVGRMEEP